MLRRPGVTTLHFRLPRAVARRLLRAPRPRIALFLNLAVPRDDEYLRTVRLDVHVEGRRSGTVAAPGRSRDRGAR
jgi:hypothetical protein